MQSKTEEINYCFKFKLTILPSPLKSELNLGKVETSDDTLAIYKDLL
jgi:hypothetical protein